MCDSIYADHGHLDDPHLWERARLLGLDLERFDADRRSGAVADRVRADFESGIRAGVIATPTAFAARQSGSPSGSPDAPRCDCGICNIARVREREFCEKWPPSGRSKGKANT